jgi:hypothetical protein
MSNSRIATILNSTLDNVHFRYAVLVIVSVFAGYTLQPVPKYLNSLFDTSILLKYAIQVLVLATAAYPLNDENIFPVLLAPVVVLGIFELLRKFESSKELAIDVNDRKGSKSKRSTAKGKVL